MKILIDMNLSPRWQKFLTEAGLQAAHWSELGAGDASASISWLTPRHTTMSQIRAEQLAPDLIGSHIVSALRQLAVELDYGALVTVEPKRTRMRVLPLREQSP
jgi:predicted nuclease of predicted toxin-antitoxin system